MARKTSAQPNHRIGYPSYMFSISDLESFLRRDWASRGEAYGDDDRMGVCVTSLVEHSNERNSEISAPYADLWVAILDEMISWEISLLSTCLEEIKIDREHPTTSKELYQSVTMCLMKIVSDSISIRHLILIGYDNSARTILRSVSEYMELLVSLMDDPSLASEFVKSDTPESAHAFWKGHLRGPLIRRRIETAWRKFFTSDHTEEHDMADWFSKWASKSNKELSGTLHPSYAGGVFSTIPLKTKYNNENWLGVWGDKSDGSSETIFIYCKFMFSILMLTRGFPFETPHKEVLPINYNKGDELHRHIKIGKDVLASLILSLSKESNTEYIFPKYDMSIWSDSTP